MRRSARLPVLIVLACALPARADDIEMDGDKPDNAALAKQKFEKGRELVKVGNSAEACPLFEESLKLAPGLGTKLNLAICWAAIGRLVDAQQLFEVLVKETEVADQPQRLQLAQQGLDSVNSRVAHIKIDASGLPEGEAVELDNKPADVTRTVPIDPGHHKVHAAHAMPVELDVAEGKTAEVKLELITVKPRPDLEYYVAGAAGGALVITLFTGIAVLNEKSNALHHCGSSNADGSLLCSQRGIDLLDRAHTMSHVSTGFLVAGVAAAAFTAVLELKWRQSNESPTATAWTAPHAMGVALEASW